MIKLLLCTFFLLVSGTSYADTAGPRDCGSSADVANWTSDANACGSNDSRATIANATQTDLLLTVFGFSLTDGAVIGGFQVYVEGNGPESVAGRRNVQVGLTKNGTALVGTREAYQALQQTTDGTLTFGGTTNLFGTTWTEAEVEATTFGVMLRHDGDAYTRNIDNVSVTVTYTVPPNRRRVMQTGKLTDRPMLLERAWIEWMPFTMKPLPRVQTKSPTRMAEFVR